MKNYCLITGASSGIGREFARKLAKDYNLILVARREERLKELANELDTECLIKIVDISKREGIEIFFDEIKDLKIEVFINNAGFGDCGLFLETDVDKELKMIDVNISALYLLNKLIIKKMNDDNIKGYILNVGSIAGILRCGPYMSQYYATKSYVVSLTLGVRRELKEEKVDIYMGCLCPGPVNTEFNQVADVKFALKGISPEKCVKIALKKMYKKKAVIVPSRFLRFVLFFRRYLTVNALSRFISRQQKKKIYN